MELKIKTIDTKPRKNDMCTGCFLEKYVADDDACDARQVMKTVTGVDCAEQKIIFVKKENWVTCTKENTEVGDTVRNNLSKDLVEIKYIFNSDDRCVVESSGEDCSTDLSGYEINLNK